MRFFQNFSANPKNRNYGLYCKFHLLRYKPWANRHEDALGSFADNTIGWVQAWAEFCSSDLGKTKLPTWLNSLESADIFLADNEIQNEEMDRELDDELSRLTSREDQEDWMINQNRTETLPRAEPINNNNDDDSLNYWAQDRKFYSSDELEEMSTWLDRMRRESDPNEIANLSNIDPATLNENQFIAYDLVKRHLEQNTNKQLLLRMEGPGGKYIYLMLNYYK